MTSFSLQVEDTVSVNSLLQGILPHFVDRMCQHIAPIYEREYQVVHLIEENELLKKELAANEATLSSLESDKQRLEAANNELQREKDQLISQRVEASAMWEAQRCQLLR